MLDRFTHAHWATDKDDKSLTHSMSSYQKIEKFQAVVRSNFVLYS